MPAQIKYQMPMSKELIHVEVAFARPDKQMIVPVDVAEGTTAKEAVEKSAITEHFPEIDLENAKLGIFGKAQKPDTVLKAGDRVEIYRPLIADPKESRRRRAEDQKK